VVPLVVVPLVVVPLVVVPLVVVPLVVVPLALVLPLSPGCLSVFVEGSPASPGPSPLRALLPLKISLVALGKNRKNTLFGFGERLENGRLEAAYHKRGNTDRG
jgi:hypothetical protein